jgi:hypothetical protein
MTSYGDLTAQEAASALEEFLGERAAALRHFEDEVGDAVSLDRSVASLGPAWRWLKPRLRPGPPDGPQPTWSRLGLGEHEKLDAASLRLVDGLVSYVAEVVQAAAPAVTWRVGSDPDPRFLNRNHPMLTLGAWEQAPAWTVGNLARQVFGEWPPSDDRLASVIGTWVANLAGESGPESAGIGPAYEVSDLRDGSAPAEFDFEVSLDEDLADEKLVADVADGLRAVAGVLEVHVEDRNVLLVRAPGWDENRLARWLDRNLRRQ